MNKKIKQYWDERAKENALNPTATTNDVYLRELEIATLIQAIKGIHISRGTLLDAGCGDGYSTLRIAQKFPNIRFVGVDYSSNMIKAARHSLEDSKNDFFNVKFRIGNVEKLVTIFRGNKFDAIITDRCLINLDSAKRQYDAIRQIESLLKPGGHFIAIENFINGQNAMNKMRSVMGLSEIPVRWHNLFFLEDEFCKKVKRLFESVRFCNFSSSYYFATRVIYSSMCQMRDEKPDYSHDIHKLAVRLPWLGDVSPIKMVIMKKKG
ncbi:MAG TPA: class I SAM-dependent methyltransferase [Chitinivibrionales bacterium]|nr:class I SAM-dependent methyltransferase [Chitinivibrionales bacterium]